MDNSNVLKNEDRTSPELAQKLMVSGFVCSESSCVLSVEVRRGMSILSKDGVEVGKVAAVVLDGEQQKATHLLLGRLPEMSGYRVVPVELITQVSAESLRLSIADSTIESLPNWHSV